MTQDYAEILKWYRKAAEQGYARAQHNLGMMYRDGEGVPRDYAEALKWFSKAAVQGDARAQASLGIMYTIGSGVPQDYVLALMWSNLAASQENEGAISLRELVAGMMTFKQFAEAQKLAREWKPK